MPGGSRPGGMRRCDARGTRPKDALSWFVIEVVTSAASRMRVSCNKHLYPRQQTCLVLQCTIGRSTTSRVLAFSGRKDAERAHAFFGGAMQLAEAVLPDEEPIDWTNAFVNQTITTPSTLQGSQRNRTLIKGCRFHDISGNGLTLRDVDTVRVENCVFENISGTGIHMSITGGGTKNVTLIGNRIQNCGKNGITGGQRYKEGVDQKNYRVLNNRIETVGLEPDARPGLLHGIYVQSQDFLIEGNTVLNARDGNGISVRSSGVVRGNTCDGAAKSGISYYADHLRGPSDLLLIEQNLIRNVGRDSGRCGIDLLKIPNGKLVVHTFIIRQNQIEPGPASDCEITVHPDYERAGITVVIE